MKSEFVDEILAKIEKSVQGTFKEIEDAKVELKDLSTGNNWISLKETICAFLNTDGGYVFCGVRERDKGYKISGFNRKLNGKDINPQKYESLGRKVRSLCKRLETENLIVKDGKNGYLFQLDYSRREGDA